MKLSDKIWQNVEGGYGVFYDASIPLSHLEGTSNSKTINTILEELWNELHHQGNVGLASYLTLPQLVRIGKSKGLFNWKLVGLCCVIEQQRHLGNNPDLPSEFKDYYNSGLLELKRFVLDNIDKELDNTTYIISLSTLATCSGQIKLGKAIMELEDKDILNTFLDQF